MTTADVRERVEAIRAAQHDDEEAHSLERELWRDVLCAIARGESDPVVLAEEALRSGAIVFARWCA